MPSPAKRVAAQPMSLDDRDLLAISEEKKAMVLTFGAGGFQVCFEISMIKSAGLMK